MPSSNPTNNFGDAPPPPYFTVRMNPPPVSNNNSKNKDHLMFSVFNVVCCSLFLGLPALIFSIKAREQYQLGLNKQAEDNAKTAKKLNLFGLVTGILSLIFLFVFYYYYPIQL